MPTPQEIAELKALDKEIEKQSLRRLRANRSIDFVLQFAGYAQAEVDRVRDAVVRKGVQFDCTRGCAYCCHFRVDALPQETFRIAREVHRRGDVANTIAALEHYLEQTREATTYRRGAPCVFLVDDACSIYAIRPFMCRKCNSLDVEKCKDADAVVPENPELAHKSGAILHGTIAAYSRNKLCATPHELARGLLLALRDESAQARWFRGEDVFGAA